jgi:hypothetical protein
MEPERRDLRNVRVAPVLDGAPPSRTACTGEPSAHHSARRRPQQHLRGRDPVRNSSSAYESPETDRASTSIDVRRIHRWASICNQRNRIAGVTFVEACHLPRKLSLFHLRLAFIPPHPSFRGAARGPPGGLPAQGPRFQTPIPPAYSFVLRPSASWPGSFIPDPEHCRARRLSPFVGGRRRRARPVTLRSSEAALPGGLGVGPAVFGGAAGCPGRRSPEEEPAWGPVSASLVRSCS